MTDQSTIDRLHIMKLTKMAENYLLQEQDQRIKAMSFDERFALMVEAGRTLNRRRIEQLATCAYIDQAINVFITGKTGEGKTYLACALGNCAIDLDIADLIHKRRRQSSTIFCSQYPSEEWYDQLGGANNPLAEAVLDRIIHDAYELRIEAIDPNKDISMREVYRVKLDDET